jgi:ubiquinone biosynthesis protein
VVDQLQPLLRRVLASRYHPEAVVKRGRDTLQDFLNVAGGVPHQARDVPRDARRGKIRVDLDLKRLDQFGRQLHRTIDRATMGIMTASLVIGSAIVMNVHEGPAVFGIPVLTLLGFMGYLAAFVNSVWVILGIWRSGKE